jgi:hypothetical protein
MYPIEPEDKALNLSPKGFASRVYAYLSGGDQVINNITVTDVHLNNVRYDTLGEFDIVAYTFTPLFSGWYAIMSQVTWVSKANTGDGRIELETVNGIVVNNQSRGLIPISRDFTQCINVVEYLVKGKLVKLCAWHNIGVGLTRSLMSRVGDTDYTWMCIHRLS